MISRICRGETEDLFLETDNDTELSWCTDFQHGQENTKKQQRWEAYTCSNMSFSVTGEVKCWKSALIHYFIIIIITIKKTAHATSPGTQTSSTLWLAWIGYEWPVTKSDYHTANAILLLWTELRSQPSSYWTAFHITETRQAQAVGEAGNGYGGFTLSPLQVRKKLQCWEACTMLQKFIAVKAKRGSLWPSNLTCCLTRTVEFQLATPVHIALSFLPSLHLFLSLFFLFCLFVGFLNTRKIQTPKLPVHHFLKKLLCFLKSKQKLERKQYTHLPCCPSCYQINVIDWVKVIEIIWSKGHFKRLSACKALNTKIQFILQITLK